MARAIAVILSLLIWASGGVTQVKVIANKNVPVNEIDKIQLLDFYTGDIKTWENGQPVIVFDLKPKGDAKESFYKFLGKPSSRMKSIWIKNMLSGEGDPPEALASEEEMVKKVASTPGAIGFVGNSFAGASVKTIMTIVDDGS